MPFQKRHEPKEPHPTPPCDPEPPKYPIPRKPDEPTPTIDPDPPGGH